jgi:predicted dehydrogenase
MNTTSQSARVPGKVNVAVVGLGFMGVTHLKAYLQTPGARLAAVCDSVRLPVNGVLAGVKGNITGSADLDLGRDVRVCRELAEVLADPGVDLVDLCVPTPLHVEHALAALHAGKHVLCEKPLALSSRQARELVEAAKSARGFFMPAMCMRFWPGWAWLKRVVEEKTYGKVQSAGFRRLSEAPAWSKATYGSAGGSGGALLDLHIHDTDFVQFLFGRPQAVFSSGVTRDGGYPDHIVTQYIYPGGPVVHAEGSWLLAKGFQMSYALHCERATLDFNLARGAEALHVLEPGKDPQVVKFEESDGYGAEIRYLVGAILNGQAPTVVTAEDGLSAIEICEAEAESVRSGKVVEL